MEGESKYSTYVELNSALYIFVLRVQDGEAFRRNFNSQDRLENAFLRIKIAHQGLSAWRRGAKMYKVELKVIINI